VSNSLHHLWPSVLFYFVGRTDDTKRLVGRSRRSSNCTDAFFRLAKLVSAFRNRLKTSGVDLRGQGGPSPPKN